MSRPLLGANRLKAACPASLAPSALSDLPRDELVAVVKTRLHNYRCYTAHSKLHSWSLSFPSSEPTLPSHPVSSVHCLQLQHPSTGETLLASRILSGSSDTQQRENREKGGKQGKDDFCTSSRAQTSAEVMLPCLKVSLRLCSPSTGEL
ncbi:hypothetical protein AOLI_G00080230 [Acnodon oligacanthus]